VDEEVAGSDCGCEHAADARSSKEIHSMINSEAVGIIISVQRSAENESMIVTESNLPEKA
jgi:hypothetical protein